MINTRVGKYKLTKLLGKGGMAVVYEAEHEALGSKAAVKVLNPELSVNAQIRERFKNEARMMASMNHPNIVRVLDYEEMRDSLAIAMELLEGQDLQSYIRRKRKLSVQEIKDIFNQVLAAFQYAHERGIVHRDIKPSNIFVLPNGHVKILDFGIAKLFGLGQDTTETGMQMGTPVYMSPEQVKADKSIDYRSDIYSLGVTLYFMLNGLPPYDSKQESYYEIYKKIVEEPLPNLTGKNDMERLILKACMKNREDRFQSCEEWLKTMLLESDAAVTLDSKSQSGFRTHSEEEPTLTMAARRGENHLSSPKKTKSWIVYAAAALLVIVVGYLMFNGGDGEEPPVAGGPGNDTSTVDTAKTEFFTETAPQDNNFNESTKLDSDKDGVPNAHDKCPNEKGSKKNNGCKEKPDNTEAKKAQLEKDIAALDAEIKIIQTELNVCAKKKKDAISAGNDKKAIEYQMKIDRKLRPKKMKKEQEKEGKEMELAKLQL